MVFADGSFAQLQTPNVQAPSQVDIVAITFTPQGPYPSAFTHAASPFVVFLLNRSGELDDTFSLRIKGADSGSGQGAAASLLDLHSTHSRQRDHALISPLPGTYELRSRAHPDQVVEVTITAN
jgi:hypothetical protein